MLAHVPASKTKKPTTALIIGGGDGGIARELCKYPSLKSIIIAELDEKVIEVSKKYLKKISNGFTDKRITIEITDGAQFVKKQKTESFDIIIIDSTDPIGPGIVLFKEKFYKECARILKENGHFSAQGLAPLIQKKEQITMYKNLKKVFPFIKPYTLTIPSYPTALWTMFHASKHEIKQYSILPSNTKYVTKEILENCYNLPAFQKDYLL
jgi:spermidine synthase